MLHAPEHAFAVTLSVLVVTCPCALSLATPTAVTAASGALTRMGLLTTRGHALETLAQVSHVLFDKTGTLTRGLLQLSRLTVLDRARIDEARCHEIAAALESGSEHPVAKAIAAHVVRAPRVDALVALPGQGMQGEVGGRQYRIGNPAYVAALSAGVPPEIGDVTIAFGSDAEDELMQEIARDGNGQFRRADETDIEELYRIISTYF